MPRGLLVTRDLLIDRTRTRTTGLRARTEGPKQLVVNRRPADGRDKDKHVRAKDKHTGSNAVPGKQATADGPDKDGEWLGVASGVAIGGNQDLEICSRVPFGLLVTRRPADGIGKGGDEGAKDEDKGAKDKAKRPRW